MVTPRATDDAAMRQRIGTLQNGQHSELWLRWTACLRKIDGAWLIVHDQVSAPVDFASGRALLDLEP